MNKSLNLAIISAFLVFLIAPMGLAQVDFVVEADGVYLSPGNFTLKLTNTLGRTDNFGVTVLGSYRNWVYFDQSYVTLYPDKPREINFNIEAPSTAESGVYSIPVFVYSLSDETIYSQKEIKILLEESYEAEIKSLEINKKSFKPGEIITINGKLSNTGTEYFKDILLINEIVKDGQIIETHESSFSLEKGEDKLFEKTIEIEENEEPGDYKVNLYLMYGEKTLDKKTIDYNIEEFGKIQKEVDSSWTPVGEFGTVKVTNIGNIEKTEKISMEIKRPWDIFLTSSQKGEKEYRGNMALYVWEVTLDVGEKKNISYQIHYWPLIILSILVIYGGYWTFKNLRRPKLKKSAVNIKELEDNRKEIMVSLEIKNIGENLKEVIIDDFIPPVAKLVKDFETVKPKITKNSAGVTKVTWNLKDLDKHENRILTYKIETLIGTLDYIKLPKATLKAKIGEREIKTTSSSLKIEEKE